MTSNDVTVRESGRQILVMMVRMQKDKENTYVVRAYDFNSEEVKLFGHGYEGADRGGRQRGGQTMWEVNVNTKSRDPVRVLTHELGGAESSSKGGQHDGPSVAAENNYRRIRQGCGQRENHKDNYAGACP